MSYFALTYINLPPDNRKAPGDEISDEEFEAAGQTAEDIKALIESKAIGGEDDPINKDHVPDVPPPNPNADENVIADEGGVSE